MKVNVDRAELTEADVVRADECVRSVARWNRNGYGSKEVVIVTTDITDLRALGARPSRRYLQSLGICYTLGARNGLELKGIWLNVDQELHSSLETIVHELVHAYSGSTISHEESFRRLCVIATGEYHRRDSRVMRPGMEFHEWAENLCLSYQRDTHANPYEADKHLLGYAKYREAQGGE